MPRTEDPPETAEGGSGAPWRWATVLAVQPTLTTGVLVCTGLFGLVSTATTTFGIPAFLPLLPGALTLALLGAAYLYTPVYVAGLALDRRRVRASGAARCPPRSILLGGAAQVAYVVVPITQAYGGATLEELVFGSVELAALLCAGAVTVRYLAARGGDRPEAPPLVSVWAGVWTRLARRSPCTASAR